MSQEFLPSERIVGVYRVSRKLYLLDLDTAISTHDHNVIQILSIVGFHANPRISVGVLKPVHEYFTGDHVLIIVAEASCAGSGVGAP